MSTNTHESVSVETDGQIPAYRLYKDRFYVLFVFSMLTFNQCMIWLTFSPIARSTESYYGIDDDTVTLFLNWGPIIFIPCLPITYIWLNKPHGLRKCIVFLGITNFIAAALRVIPSIITQPSSPHFSSITLPFLHAGQILNAACGPLVMAPVSQISCLWFAPHERTRATTIAIFANNFGSTIGFVISPFIVDQPDHVPRILYLHLGLAFVACVLVVFHFPAQPPTPPSAAAELIIHDPENAGPIHNWRTFLRDAWICMTNPAFILLSLAGGLLNGMTGAWTGLFDILLKPENFTETQAGWFGFGTSIAGIVGAMFLSALADKPRFQHSLKILILICLVAGTACVVWFEFSVQSLFYANPLLPSTGLTIGLSTALVGLFAGAASPLIYEGLAEIMYPLPESLSASILVQWINIVSLIFLFVAPKREKLVNLLVLVVMVLCIVMVLFTKFTYARRDEDKRRQIERENSQSYLNRAVNIEARLNNSKTLSDSHVY